MNLIKPYGLLPAPQCVNMLQTPAVQGPLQTRAIFLGTEWDDPQFAGDKIEGIHRFLSGWDGSLYGQALLEYTHNAVIVGQQVPHPDISIIDGSPMQLGYQGYSVLRESKREIFDNSPAPGLNEVCQGLVSGQYPQAPSGKTNYFLIYSSTGIGTPSNGGSCDLHGSYTCTTGASYGLGFDYAVIYNADHTPECDVDDHETGHSQGLAAAANSSARAIADEFTDPDWAGWMTLAGSEVSDLCPWQFDKPYVWFVNGSRWKLQDLWSDGANLLGIGYPNQDGKRGCVLGG